MLKRALLAAAVLLGTGTTALAGVAGHSFGGTLVNRSGQSGDLCIAFDDASNEWVMRHEFPTDPGPTTARGTYVETDLFLFSFFNGQVGARAVSGFQIFGFVIFNVSGPGGSVAAQGSAFLADCAAPNAERERASADGSEAPRASAADDRRRPVPVR